MSVSFASEPAPGAVNEDHVVATPDLVAVLDGVTTPAGLDTGCVHGTPWYVRRLAARLVEAHALDPVVELGAVVAAAIAAVRADHGGVCDLDHPGTPSSTVCMLRAGATAADYLVLSDSPLVLDRGGRVEVVTDLRLSNTSTRERAALLNGSTTVGSPQHRARVRALVEAQRSYRNQPGGYWLAAAAPSAGHHAITGTVSLAGPERLTRAALLSDGASRAVEVFDFTDWPGLLDQLATNGPTALLAAVRGAELADLTGADSPRVKAHDDATAAYCHFT